MRVSFSTGGGAPASARTRTMEMGGMALLTMEEMKGRLAFLGRIKNARFNEKVVPGDVLELETVIDVIKENIGIGSGKAYVRGKLVASCELVFAISAG